MHAQYISAMINHFIKFMIDHPKRIFFDTGDLTGFILTYCNKQFFFGTITRRSVIVLLLTNTNSHKIHSFFDNI
jgi:hypothetical protein